MLERILLDKIEEVDECKQKLPLKDIKSLLAEKPKTEEKKFFNSLLNKISLSKPGLIAEIKFASPSKGVIRDDLSPEDVAKVYNDNNHVSCISVLTEKKYFRGDPSYIQRVKNVTNKPILRKDFIIDEYQIYESAYLGADCILLIATCLTKSQLCEYLAIAQELGLDALVEIYNERDLVKVEGLPINMIGVNSRNLKTLEVSIENQEKMLEKLPKEVPIKVAESGIKTKEDIFRLINVGFNAFLIGETFMKAENISSKIDELFEDVKID